MGYAGELIVVGAGPAGATLARLLALRQWQVTLIDPLSSVIDRLELLSPSSRPVLEAVGLTKILEDREIAEACPGIRRKWGTMRTDFDDFLLHPGGTGFVVDRARFDASLRNLAAAWEAP